MTQANEDIESPALQRLLELGLQPPALGDWPPSLREVEAVFPELEVLALLGQGATGAVFHTRDRQTGQDTALKIISPQLMLRPELVARFGREAEAMRRLMHPGIAAVRDHGERAGLFYLQMEHVDAANLRLAVDAPVPPAVAVTIAVQLCDALQYAHDQGVVHRDIKPENVLMTPDGHVTIVDFGLAKLRVCDTPWTLTGASSVVGTPLYLAPEQIETPTLVDARADLFAVGVLLYEMLTGKLPIGRFAVPSKLANVSRDLDAVVVRALQPDREARFGSAAQMKEALTGRPRRRTLWRRSRYAAVGLALTAGGITLAADDNAHPRVGLRGVPSSMERQDGVETGAAPSVDVPAVVAATDAPDVEVESTAEAPASDEPEYRAPQPKSIRETLAVGRVAEREGRFDDAVARYDELLQQRPEHDVARFRRGRALYGAGRHQEAAKALHGYLQDRSLHRPDVSEALYFAGLSFAKLGLCREAIVYFDKVHLVTRRTRQPSSVGGPASEQAQIIRAHLDGTDPVDGLSCANESPSALPSLR